MSSLPASYKIREVDGYDSDTASTLHALHTLTFFSNAPKIDPTRGHWWLAYSASKEPVAFAGIVPAFSFDNGGYLVRSGVLPSHRGHGLQKRLLKVREQKAKRNGWNIVVTDTTYNLASSNSLISCGYRLFKPARPWAFPESLYWRKAV